ncbi:hypothetical protein JQ574_25320 [Bradyrhizobium sp. AUGA SZCCT0158]|uniref:hypothetical protein n=1 Tax=Bradyrhizobium sp. AUGA SZCCT0158 TaxID=2807661 RepID=UPI001BAC3D7F|nr:hypothetical protein [Bradyrhizobium sp. AUGA SZCCT0158]MBR1199323.1 hypothetical protein [Bradyrhizobium sp. AUGA SZCCT0158]
MQITAAGWARNHGAVTVVEVDLTSVEATEGPFTYGPSSPVLGLGKGWSKNIRQVVLNCFASMKFTGDYGLKVTIEKEEIARLYRLTHQAEIADAQRRIEALQSVIELFAEPTPESPAAVSARA